MGLYIYQGIDIYSRKMYNAVTYNDIRSLLLSFSPRYFTNSKRFPSAINSVTMYLSLMLSQYIPKYNNRLG